jgi:Spy/CpxP family protein refolding chaperone
MQRAGWIAGMLAGLAGFLGSAARVDAQPRRGPLAERRDDGGLATSERREQIKKKIRAMRAFTLTEELALDEATASQLFPVLARYDDETDKLLEKRLDVQRRLRHADTLRDNRAIDRLIEEALANQRGFRELEDRRLAELRKILTPVQTAKVLVVLPALERRIQNQLRKAISRRAGKAGDRASERFIDEDDDQEPDELPGRGASRPRREAPLAPRSTPSNAPGNTLPCDPNGPPCR